MADIKVKIKLKSGGDYEITPASGLQSFESLNQTTASPDEIFYGVIPNRGSITGTDIDGSIESLIKNGEIDKDCAVEIWENGEQKAAHIITDSEYSPDKDYTIELSNKLSKWENIPYAGYAYTKSIRPTLYDIALHVFKSVFYPNDATDSNVIEMFEKMPPIYVEPHQEAYSSGNVSIIGYLTQLEVGNDYIEPCSLKEAIDKICAVAQLQCTEDDVGNPIFIMARPQGYKGQAYSLSPSMLMSLPTKDLLNKNKISEVKITYKDRQETLGEDVKGFNQTNIQGTTNTTETTDTNGNQLYSLGNYSITYNGLTESGTKIQFINFAHRLDNLLLVDGNGYLKYGAEQLYRIKIRTEIKYVDNLGLNEILQIGTGVDFSVKYTHKKGTLTTKLKGNTLNSPASNFSNGIRSIQAIITASGTESAATETTDGSGQITSVFEYPFQEGNSTIAIAGSAAYSPIQVQTESGKTYLYTTAIVGKKTYTLNASQSNLTLSQFLQWISTQTLDWTGEWEEYVPSSIAITFKGQTREISFKDSEIATTTATKDIPTFDIGELGGDVFNMGFYIVVSDGTATTETISKSNLSAYYKKIDFDFLTNKFNFYSNMDGREAELSVGDILYEDILATTTQMAELKITAISSTTFTAERTKYKTQSFNPTSPTNIDFINEYKTNILSDYKNGIATAKATICNTDIDGADLSSPIGNYELVVTDSALKDFLLSDSAKKYSSYTFDAQTGNILMIGELDNNNVIVGSSLYYQRDEKLYFLTVNKKEDLESQDGDDHLYTCSGIEYTVKLLNAYELIRIYEDVEVIYNRNTLNQNLYRGYSFNEETGALTGNAQTAWVLLNTGETFYYLQSDTVIVKGIKTSKETTISGDIYVYAKNCEHLEVFAPNVAKYDLIKTNELTNVDGSPTEAVLSYYGFFPHLGVFGLLPNETLFSEYEVGDIVFKKTSDIRMQRLKIISKTSSRIIHNIEVYTITKRKEEQEKSIAETLKWDNGETLKLGDIVRVDKDNNNNANSNMFGDTIFRVTGIHYKYDGAPTQDLELQEIK